MPSDAKKKRDAARKLAAKGRNKNRDQKVGDFICNFREFDSVLYRSKYCCE